MLRNLCLAIGLTMAGLASAQTPITTPKGDWTGVDKSPISPAAQKRAKVSKPHFVSTQTAPTGPNGIFGRANPELENFHYDGPRVEPKPGEPPVTTIQADLPVPNGVQDSSYLFGWDGIPGTGWVPADTDQSVGPKGVIQVVNVAFRFFDRCGNQTYANNFANFVGAPYNGYFLFDPKVIFDPWTSRWVMLIHGRKDSAPRDSVLILFVSDDDDPIGSWTWYALGAKFTFGTTENWADYYDLGYGVNGIYLSGNHFSWTNSDHGTVFYGLQKADLYNGGGLSWWYWYYNNPGGLEAWTPRPANAQVGGFGSDVQFVGLPRLGGSSMDIWRWTDPWGANTFTHANIPIAAYNTAPTAYQPSGRNWFGFDARLLEAVLTYDFVNGGYHLYTCQNINVGGEMGLRFYDLDSPANAARWQYNYYFGANTTATMGSPAADYGGNVHWAFSYATSGTFPSAAVVAFNNGTNEGAWQTRGGNANCGFGRWGDYAGGAMDWADYFATGQYATRLWTYAMWENGGDWGTRGTITTGSPTTPGVLTGTDGNPVNYTGVGGGSGYTNGFMTIGNTGGVGFPYEVTSWTGWVTPTSPTKGEIFAGQTIQINFSSNANADALPYGRHTATATVRNCYNGATVTRNVMTLSLGHWMCPDATVYLWGNGGQDPSGDGTDVCTSDNVYFTIFNDSASLETDFYFQWSGVIDGSEYAYSSVELATARAGLQVQLYIWQSDSPYGWILQNGYVCPTNDTTFAWSSGQGNADKFIHSNGNAWIRIKTSPINDEQPAVDGWQTRVDKANLWTYP